MFQPALCYIEISGACNACCPYCVKGSGVQDQGGFMSVKTFDKILDYLSVNNLLPISGCIHIFNWGEPTIHPKINEIIGTVGKYGLRAFISSNLIYLSKFNRKSLSILNGIEISLSGFSQSTYGRIHGKKLKTVLGNIDDLLKMVKNSDSHWKPAVKWHRYRFNENELNDARTYFLNRNISFHPVVAYLNDIKRTQDYFYNNTLEPEENETIEKDLFTDYLKDSYFKCRDSSYECPQWSTITIDENANLLLCCGLSNREKGVNLGSIFKVPLEKLSQIKRSSPHCKKCLENGIIKFSCSQNMERFSLDSFLSKSSREENLSSVNAHKSNVNHEIKKEKPYPLISIGMPVYNSEKYLAKAIDSLLDQDFENFELVISDNASTDRTENICLDYEKKDGRIKYYRNDYNMGPTINFKRVFELSKGKYFMWAADDLWHPAYISKLVGLLEKNPSAVLAVSEIDLIDDHDNKQGNFYHPFPSSTTGMSKCERIVYSLGIVYGHLTYGIFKRNVLSETSALLFEWPSPLGSFGRDVVRVLRCLGHGDLLVVNEPLFYYRIGGLSTKVSYSSINAIMKHFSVAAQQVFNCFDLAGLTANEIFKVQNSIVSFLRNWMERPYSQALAKRVVTADKITSQGEELFAKGDTDGAMISFRKALEIEPNHASAHNNIGVLCCQTNIQDALNYFQMALKLDPDDRNTVINIAELFKSLQQIEDTKNIYTTYLQKNHDDHEISRLLEELGGIKKIQGINDSIATKSIKINEITPGGTGIIVFGHSRPVLLRNVLESLRRQKITNDIHVWLDGHHGRGSLIEQVGKCRELVKKMFPDVYLTAVNGNIGIEKLTIDGLSFMASRYERIIILEDDCFPVKGAISEFEKSLDEIEARPDVYSIYGHHFLTEFEGETITRFQGWGWATTRKKLIPVLEEIKQCFDMSEPEFLKWVKQSLAPEVIRRLDVTPGRNCIPVISSFFCWDGCTCLITAKKGLVHKRTNRRVIYNCGMGNDSTHFTVNDTNRLPPLNMITPDEVWDYYEKKPGKINSRQPGDAPVFSNSITFEDKKETYKSQGDVSDNLKIKNSKIKTKSGKEKLNGKLGENLIFIISQPRAGSTLLQRILSGHSEIHTMAESWVMLHPSYALKRGGISTEYDSALARQGLDDFLMQVPEGEELYIEALREMANVLYNKMINVSGKKYFLDKTPRYYFIIPELYRVFPNAKFIFLMRNPVAVLSSVLKTWCGNILQNLVNRPIYTDLIKGPHYLLEGIKGLKEDAIVVHYEKLVQNPKEVMQHVCKRIGIPFYDNMLEYGLHLPPEGRFGDQIGVYKHSRPVSEYIDKWTENLQSPDLIEFAQKYLLDLGPEVISRMGYSYQNIMDKLEPKRLFYKKSKGEIKESSELNQQGEDLFAKDNFDGALDVFTKALNKDSSNAIVHNNLGVLYYNRGDKEKAFSHYKKAAEFQPGNITFQKNLADFYYVEMGRVEEAMEIYVKVLNANPEDVETLLIIGHICVALKKLDDAKDFYSRILIIEPWNKDAKQFLEELEKCQLSVAGDRLGSEDIETASKEYFVSAIVSTYNSERFIRGCLEDLENQTIADRLEIIVVNSGSEQNEDKIIKEFQEKYSNIKYIKTDKRETVYAAWNRGIKAATGKYIANANTDDRHRKDAFEVMINILEKRPEIALVYADVIITETENETFENCTTVGYFNWMDWNREDLLNKGCFMGPQPMWRRDVHDEYGYFDNSFVTSGDYEFWLRISQTNTFLHLPVRLGLYLRSPGSIEHLNREKQREENNKIFKMYSESHSSGKNIRCIGTDLPQASVIKIDERRESKLKAINPDIQVSIIVPTSGQQKYLKKCVESIKKYTSQLHEIIFVDNGTTKGTRKWLNQNIKENSKYIMTKCAKDAGFVGIYNQGIKLSTGEYILLLSNDVVVTKGWLSGMLECMQSIPDSGIVGPMSNISWGTQKVSNKDNVSTDQLDEFAESFMTKNRYRRISSNSIDGFCMLFARDLVEEIGLFDEQFGKNGYEDEDFCLRALLEGRKNLIAGDVYVHQQGKKAFVRNKKYFNTKWNKADAHSLEGKKFLTLKAIEKGKEAYQKGYIDNAVGIFLEGIGLSPNDKRAYYALAEILTNDKKYKDVIEVLNEMPPDEQDAKRLELIGYCKEGMKLYDEAQDYANQALNLNPSSAPAKNLKGVLAYNQGDNHTAEDFFNKAVESDPGYGEPYTNLGAIRWDKNQDEALNLFEKGFILSPTSPDIITNYHTAASALGEFERAGQIFKEAGLLYPNNKNIKYKFIDFLLKLEKHVQAMYQIEEAIALFGVDDGILPAALKIRDLLGPKEIGEIKNKINTVSLCMIVNNEEQNLAKCLRSVKPVVGEMIVVDTGSTDRTKDIAEVFGAKVYDFKWTDDFSEARNFSLSKASGKWNLIMDADEAISSLDYSKFKKIIEKSKPVAYQFTTRNYTLLFNMIEWNANDEKYIDENAGVGWIPSDKVRLFPNNPGVRFEYPIHELIEPSLKKAGIEVEKCKIPIHHYGNLNQKKSDDKGEIYYQIGRKKLDEMGDNEVALCELAIQAETLGKHEESIELWERLIKIKPETALAFVNMGTAYAKLGKYEKAVSAASKALEIEPDMKEAHYNYAFAKVHLGQVKEAVLVIEKLLSRFSEYPPAQFLLSVAYCLEARGAKWRKGFEKLRLTMGPGLAVACHEFAKGLVSAKRSDYAVTLLEAAIESKNNNKEIDELYSKCLEMMKVDRKTGTSDFRF